MKEIIEIISLALNLVKPNPDMSKVRLEKRELRLAKKKLRLAKKILKEIKKEFKKDGFTDEEKDILEGLENSITVKKLELAGYKHS